jgi:hypothetical protein
MRPTKIHTRIIQHPFAHLVEGARLESFQAIGRDLILKLQGLDRASSEIYASNGKLFERATGARVALNLCFSGVTKVEHLRFLSELENYAPDDISRTILGMYSWQLPGKKEVFYLFFLRDPVGAELMFFADGVVYQESRGETALTIERNGSPAPPMPGRLVPQPKQLHRRYGGDPITIKVNERVQPYRLFIGGTEIQPAHRPQVDAGLNLGENPSRWVKSGHLHPGDRAVTKGEGAQGMSGTEIREEATWVIDRLQKNQRVLVHCAAGMNRSATICCATLILLEGLTAEKALERVREHHPWARPDSHHWLALRWLAQNKRM